MKLKYREGVFLVVYAKSMEKFKIKYLILKRKLHWRGWEFPKGGIEKAETIKSVIKRELKEETGLKPVEITAMRKNGRFIYPRMLKDRPEIKGMKWKLFAVKVKKPKRLKIKIDRKEHSAYKWVSFSEAYKSLKFQDQRICLKLVDKYLNKDVKIDI